MANWAIVIGIDEYWRPEFKLKSCAKDAVSMMQWLLDSKSCKVLPQNMYLLTRPSPPPQAVGPIPGSVQVFDATFSALVQVTRNLMDRSAGKGDKLFVYFSGHGITNTSGVDAEEALVMADFDETFTDNAVEFRSLVEYFKGTRFSQQFFIVDACRDVPEWDGKFRTRPFTPVGEIDPTLPSVQQYTLLATAPRIKATAFGDQSAFTEELLRGLKGTGSAIALDKNTGEYVVSTSYLFKFVETQILARKINVSDDPDNPTWQKPRINGEHGSDDPELARLAADEVKEANLRVFLDPNPAWPQAEVTIVDQFGDQKAKITSITKAPENLSLPPMIYTARAAAPGYKPARAKWPFDLYDDYDLSFSLVPNPDAGAPKPITEAGGPQDISETAGDTLRKSVGKGGGVRGGRRRAVSPPAALAVRTSDTLARLELADSQGKLLLARQGAIFKSGLKPGFYRVRLVTPEGQGVEELVQLDAGEKREVTLEAPPRATSPFFWELVNTANFTIPEDIALDVANDVGPIASAHLSTILALTGSALNQDEKGGLRWRSLGLKSFRESVPQRATSGLHILTGVEFGGSHKAHEQLSGTKLRLWSVGRDGRDASTGVITESKLTGLYEFAQATDPGHYFLSVEPVGGVPVVFALAILPQRLTMLVFHHDVERQLRVFQYNLSLSQQEWKKLGQEQVRRLELAQRFYLSGRLDYALETARELLYAKWTDPLAGCLGCYLLLRLGKYDELSLAADNMVSFYGQLCDSHLVKAEYEASIGNLEVARQAFGNALDLGVPVFADGLTRLSDAVQKYQLQGHKRARLLSEMVNKRVRGFLWTAWMPSKEGRAVSDQSTAVGRDSNVAGRDVITAGRDVFVAESGDISIAGRDVIKGTKND